MAEQYKSPGWYPDPGGAPGERWWNGAGWSDTRRGGAGAPVPLPPVSTAPVIPRPDPYAPGTPFTPVSATRTGATLDFRQNRFGALSFILGLVALFGFSIAGPAAIVLGLLGISRARQLRAQGVASANMVFPTIGIVAGAIATFFLIIAIVGFFGALTFDVDG